MMKTLSVAVALLFTGCVASTARKDVSQSLLHTAAAESSPAADHATDPAAASRSAEGRDEVEGFRLQISTDKSEYLPGEPIRASIALTNVDATAVGGPVPNPPFEQYKIRVLDADDRAVPATPYGEEQMKPWKWSFGQTTLSPHRSITWTAPLDTLFELRKPGVYRV